MHVTVAQPMDLPLFATLAKQANAGTCALCIIIKRFRRTDKKSSNNTQICKHIQRKFYYAKHIENAEWPKLFMATNLLWLKWKFTQFSRVFFFRLTGFIIVFWKNWCVWVFPIQSDERVECNLPPVSNCTFISQQKRQLNENEGLPPLNWCDVYDVRASWSHHNLCNIMPVECVFALDFHLYMFGKC